MLKLIKQAQVERNALSHVRHNSDVIITEWTKQYARQLQQTRKREGLLTSSPSQPLSAELKVAEVQNVQVHV